MDAESKRLSEFLVSKPDAADKVLGEQLSKSMETTEELRANFSRQEAKLATLQNFAKAGNRDLKQTLIRLEGTVETQEDLIMETKKEMRRSIRHQEEKLESLQDLVKESNKKLEAKLSRQEEKLEALETLLMKIYQQTSVGGQGTAVEREPRKFGTQEDATGNELQECDDRQDETSQTETSAGVTDLKATP